MWWIWSLATLAVAGSGVHIGDLDASAASLRTNAKEEESVPAADAPIAPVKKYDTAGLVKFGLFENAEETRKLLKAELAALPALRAALIAKRRELSELKEGRRYSPTSDDSTATAMAKVEDVLAIIDDGAAKGARRGLLLLHDTYRLDLMGLAKGRLTASLLSISTGVTPSAHSFALADYSDLAEEAYSIGWYDTAIDFLRVALKLIKKKGIADVDEGRRERIEKLRRQLFQLNNGNLYRTESALHANFKTHRYVVTENLGRKKEQPDFVREGRVLGMSNSSQLARDAYFRAVCGGWTLKEGQREPKSHWLHRNDPFLRLAPFKLEVASEQPHIVLFKDFLTEKEISFLVETSKPMLSRERVADPYNEYLATAANNDTKKRSRIIHKSVQAWLDDVVYNQYLNNTRDLDDDFSYSVMNAPLLRLSRKLELATGLNLTAKYASTSYQVTNYGLGGLCEIHMDPHGYVEGVELPPHPRYQRLRKQGDMMATAMGWLADVPAGGGTAFCQPYSETLVQPSKGSVAFWFGLDRKGYRDHALLHGGCPVLAGTKWIMNKWTYYYDQWERFPCQLDPDAKANPLGGFYSSL